MIHERKEKNRAKTSIGIAFLVSNIKAVMNMSWVFNQFLMVLYFLF